MQTIKQFKKLARVNAKAGGTSYQAELDALARKQGHSHWGAFQKVLQHPPEHSCDEIRPLIHAINVAADNPGFHIAILRGGDHKDELRIAGLLRRHLLENANPCPPFEFFPQISNDVISRANEDGITILTTSSGHRPVIQHGNFLITQPGDILGYHNSIFDPEDGYIFNARLSSDALHHLHSGGDAPSIHVTFLPNWNPREHEHLRRYDPARYFGIVHSAAARLMGIQKSSQAPMVQSFVSALLLLYGIDAENSYEDPTIANLGTFLDELLQDVTVRFETGHNDSEDVFASAIEAKLLALDDLTLRNAVRDFLQPFLNADASVRRSIVQAAQRALRIANNAHLVDR